MLKSNSSIIEVIENLDNDEPKPLVESMSHAKSAPTENFIQSVVNSYTKSDEYNFMLTAGNYYQNNTDINKYERKLINPDGTITIEKRLSNSKLSHPFFPKLIKQKVNYSLGNFPIIKSNNSAVQKIIDKLMTRRFHRTLKRLAKEALIYGRAWLQIYYNTDGTLNYKRIPSTEVIPIWLDSDHTILGAVIRVFVVDDIQFDGTKEKVKKIEYHDMHGSWYFIDSSKGLVPDNSRFVDGYSGHFTIVDDEGMISNGLWNKPPFICFKPNEDEQSLLTYIKPLIDDYDLQTSSVSNNHIDHPEAIKVVRGYSGDIDNVGQFVSHMSLYRSIFVDTDGAVDLLDHPLPFESIEAHLTRLRKDIYDGASGIDTQAEQVGSNASGIALKLRYADLDMDAKDMAETFSFALDDLFWFYKVDEIKNGNLDIESLDDEVTVQFKLNEVINEDSEIENARRSIGVISSETIFENHPWVDDPKLELSRMVEEKDAEYALEDKWVEDTQFGTKVMGNEQKANNNDIKEMSDDTSNPEG